MIDCVAFSEDGRTLVSAGRAGIIMLWNVATRRQIFPLKGLEREVSAARALCVASDSVSAVFVYEGPGAQEPVCGTTLVRPAAGNSLANQ